MQKGRFLNRESALFFDLLIRPVRRFYFSSEQILILTLSIPLQIKYVPTGQLYMQVPGKIWIIAAFKIKSKKRLMTCPQTVPLQSRLIMSLEIRLFHLFLLFYYLSYVQDFLLFLFWFQSRFNFVFHELLFWLPFWLPFVLPNFKNPLVFRHKKSCWRESNPWPPPYQGDALPTEPQQLVSRRLCRSQLFILSDDCHIVNTLFLFF